MRSFEQPLRIHLYADPSAKTLNLREEAEYLSLKLGLRGIDIRPEFLFHHLNQSTINEVAERLASIRVKDPGKPFSPSQPLYGEVEFEKGLILTPLRRPLGILYDGLLLNSIYRSLLSKEEAGLNHLHIAFTNRLFATFDEGDHRYHARVILCGFPSLISTTGIVEAPAKPQEFYLALRTMPSTAQQLVWEDLKERFRGRYIDYDDERLTEVMKGYAMQAVFYHFLQEPFCESKSCRLYNAHLQEEVIAAQLAQREREFCDRHNRMLNELSRSLLSR